MITEDLLWDRLYFLGSKSTADGGCSHEIKRRLLLGGKPMTNLDSIIEWQRHYTKVRIVKAVVFPVVIYGYESETVKFRRCNQSILKEISLNIHWKD